MVAILIINGTIHSAEFFFICERSTREITIDANKRSIKNIIMIGPKMNMGGWKTHKYIQNKNIATKTALDRIIPKRINNFLFIMSIPKLFQFGFVRYFIPHISHSFYSTRYSSNNLFNAFELSPS